MKQLLNPDGTPKTLGVPSIEGLGDTAGITFLRPEDMPMGTKIEQDGIYELKGGRHFIAAGDELPEGAEMVTDTAEVEVDTADVKKGAPENKSKAKAPENRGS